MRLFATVAAVCSLTALYLTGVSLAQDATREQEKLQGRWTVMSASDRGDPVLPETLGRFKLTIKGNEIIPSDNPKDVLTFTIDPTAKPFPTIDMKDKEKTSLGIYDLKDDSLRLCFTEGGERPKDFTSSKDSILLNMARVVVKK